MQSMYYGLQIWISKQNLLANEKMDADPDVSNKFDSAEAKCRFIFL